MTKHAPCPDPLLREDFLCLGPQHALATKGQRKSLPSGPLATLSDRAGAFFAQNGEGPGLLVGAVPYGRCGSDRLAQPDAILPVPPTPTALKTVRAGKMAVSPSPMPQDFRISVEKALNDIHLGKYQKIVLSRTLNIFSQENNDPALILAHLRQDPLATVFAVPLSSGPEKARHLIGATPELLLEKRGGQVFSHPLAGSARRSDDPSADQAAAAALFSSDKNRREHEIAAEHVMDTLAPYCRQLAAPEGVTLTKTAAMWHLGTRITGELHDADTPCAEVLAALHPTPAVCGLPVAAAEAALPELEGYDRGFYAGAVGWLERNGDGCWYLALRCAEVSGREARLFAGAGIVAGSDPEAELAETSAKFLAMLAAFGIDEQGHPLAKE